jgi:CBS domain-containing protein
VRVTINYVLSKKKVTNIMTKAPIDSIESQLTVIEVCRIMSERSRGGLIIVEDGRPIGIVTERDMVRRVIVDNLVPAEVKVREIMSTPLITIDSKSTVLDAAELMQKNRIRRVIVTENDNITGIVTLTDIARAFASESGKDESLIKAIMRSSYTVY